MLPISSSPDLNVPPTPPLHNSSTPPPLSCSGRTCPWWPYSSPQDFTANAALILGILFSAVFIALALNAAIRYFIRRRSNNENDVEDGEVEAVSKMVFAPGVKVGAAEETECAICLSEFVQGDVIRVLDKCKHGFHFQCVQKWLVSHSSCPTCRANCN